MHAAERYVGWEYCAATADCADLVAQVQRELFGREVRLPNGRPRGRKGQAALGEMAKAYACRTEAPRDGDLVLMREPGETRAGHAGTYFEIAGEGWVLHATDRLGGVGVLHRVRDLPAFGCFIEGWYTWVD